MVGFQFRIFMFSEIDQIKDNKWSEASTRCPWRVLAKSKTIQPVPVQPSRRAFEGVRTPRSVLQINIEDVRTSEQHCPDARSISIQQGVYFQKTTLFGKSLQSVRTMSSICRPSGRLSNTTGRYPKVQITSYFRLNAERILAKTVQTRTW
jgi:hypothetical protein